MSWTIWTGLDAFGCWKKGLDLFIPEVSSDVLVVTGKSSELSLEECNIDQGGVEVDELEDEDFEGEIVVEL
jgi:hypothetical protein